MCLAARPTGEAKHADAWRRKSRKQQHRAAGFAHLRTLGARAKGASNSAARLDSGVLNAPGAGRGWCWQPGAVQKHSWNDRPIVASADVARAPLATAIGWRATRPWVVPARRLSCASARRLTVVTLDSSLTKPVSTPHSTPESSFLEPLNLSLASRSFSSPSSSPFDFPSFTTASQQSSWLSSPAPQASRHPLNTSQSAFALPQSDFVLYDQPAQASPRPQRAPSAPQPGHSFNNGHNFYANSAPTSTTEFQQPLLRQRPPVPLFSSSSNNLPQQNNAATMADLNSNNSFDSGASLMPSFQPGSFNMDQMSAFTAINDRSVGAGSTRTVSPKDIFADAFGSAPPSAAFTNLTSPDIGDSPFLNDSFECSPMFTGETMISNTSDWYSLFPEEESKSADGAFAPAPISLPLERTISSQSLERSSSSSNGSPLVLDASFRRKSSISNSPATNGISKSRRRKGPLPNITVDPADKVALKRARNTLAARESRQRKFDHVNDLERRNSELEAEVEKWKSIAMAHGYNGS